MPELPEVETVKTELTPYVVGHCVTGVTLFWDRMVKKPSVEEFRAGLIGKKITALERRGKYLLFRLNCDKTLIIHLKISGSLLLSPSGDLDRFIRAIIHLDGGVNLYFRDPRKFGAMWLVEDVAPVTGKLGPDPLIPEFTPALLAKMLAKRAAPIKAILIDQGFIAGIGNMYADEALFAAKIHPMRPGKSLSEKEVERLHHAIQLVLRKGIGSKGASEVTYYRPSGEMGTAFSEFQVAHQRGKLCPVCGTPIKRIAVRNRGTYFCPHCQPEEPC